MIILSGGSKYNNIQHSTPVSAAYIVSNMKLLKLRKSEMELRIVVLSAYRNI
jgi:hypothetical protein